MSLRGSGYRNRTAGLAFAVGALSMVGFPMLSGFISKLLFATAAVQSPHKMVFTILGLAVSTILNAIYFLRLVISIYSPPEREYGPDESHQASRMLKVASFLFVAVNLVLGLFSKPIVDGINAGLGMFL